MLRFRNPGSQYSTQIEIIKILYEDYGEKESFTLDDISLSIAQKNMMTAYGYAGDDAIALSANDDRSRDSTYNNAKMYAEIFRNLGWVVSKNKNSAYPITFSLLGKYVAMSDNPLNLYRESIMGMNSPQEIIDVKYTEKTRFFKTALRTINDMDNVLYKHELCFGPMSISDTLEKDYKKMIKHLKNVRGSYKKYKDEYNKLLTELNVKASLPDNSTRFPIGAMKTCGWVENANSNTIYPPKNMQCLSLTSEGKDYLKKIIKCKDLRLDEFKKQPKNIQDSLIRVGFYSMLDRAGYDVSKVENLTTDIKICRKITEGKDLLFSPYQTIFHNQVDEALNYKKESISSATTKKEIIKKQKNQQKESSIGFDETKSFNQSYLTEEDKNLIKDVKHLSTKNTVSQIVNIYLKNRITQKQNQFYPFVAQLFRISGFNCKVSRQGDNGSRWDAIIIDKTNSIPIEIKSPTEEKNISVKAIRQALENKIVLLSRKTYNTTIESSSFVVGYLYPNDRADVNELVDNFRKTYNIKIGILDLKNLLTIAITTIVGNKPIKEKELIKLEGMCNVAVK